VIKTAKRPIIILSIPFQRLIRSHYSPWFIHALIQQGRLQVVSPFTHDPIFLSQFLGEVEHQPPPYLKKNYIWFCSKLIALSSLMRVEGFWRKNRSNLGYLWANRHAPFSDNGYSRAPFYSRWLKDIIFLVGSWHKSWRIIDFTPSFFYCHPELEKVAREHKEVILIQCASWGLQDHLLAGIARRNKWRTVLIPYTVDQIFANGFLFCNYDVVCVQGPSELHFANNYHEIDLCRIVEFGSLNFFSMRKIIEQRGDVPSPNTGVRRILFAGSINTYFPTESEFSALEVLIKAVEGGLFGSATVTYRPIATNEKIRNAIEKRFSKRSANLFVQYAEAEVFALDNLVNPNAYEVGVRHINNISGFDVAVMVGFTSLALDLSFLGTPTIAYLKDNTGFLSAREYQKIFNKEGRYPSFNNVPVVNDEYSLIRLIKRYIEDNKFKVTQARKIRDDWDYSMVDISQSIQLLFHQLKLHSRADSSSKRNAL
jgi:hypothetical protein